MVVVHHSASRVGPGRAAWLATPAAVMDSGVAVFFVISGFLIYRPFVTAHIDRRPALRWRTFWWRRVLRIVPAYWLALSLLWAAGAFSLGRDWWRYYLFLQIYDPFTSLGGIVPAWSLDTEMAFYLLVPFWALLVRRVVARGRHPVRFELAGTLALIVAGYTSRAVLSGVDRVWVDRPGQSPITLRAVSFTWLPNHLDLFGLGMTLAVLSAWSAANPRVLRSLHRWAARAELWWGAAVLVFAWFAYRVGPPDFNAGYVGSYWQQRQAVVGLVSVCLLVPAVFGDQHRGWLRRLLRWPPVVWVGVVSYGLYLWHQDLLEQVPEWLDRPASGTPIVATLGAGFGLGLVAAALSWHLLEGPLQRRFKRLL